MAHVPSRGSSDLRPRARRHRLLAGAAVTILLLGGTVYRSSRASHIATHTGPPRPITSLALDTEPVRLPDASARGLESPVYPYSIIPGGARSKEALQRSIESDPIVRAHYANFDLAATRIVRLTQPRLAYVSYRMGNEIYWTRRPLVLKAGETVLTDGRNYARTRCGNQLAAAPPVVSDKEPSPALLNRPRTVIGAMSWTSSPSKTRSFGAISPTVSTDPACASFNGTRSIAAKANSLYCKVEGCVVRGAYEINSLRNT